MYDFPVVFSSLADVLYLSVVWFDTRSATLTKLEFLRATQQATQSAATLISSDTEMMAVLYGLLDRQDSSPPEYPFSVYRPFAFWKPADLEMLRVRKIMPKSAPVSPKLLAACFNEPIVIFKSAAWMFPLLNCLRLTLVQCIL